MDYPSREKRADADVEEDGDRPYLVLVPALNLIGWWSEDDGAGDGLNRIRIRETVVEREGAWGERAVSQIRVIYPDRYEIWRRLEASTDWSIWRSGPMARQEIP